MRASGCIHHDDCLTCPFAACVLDYPELAPPLPPVALGPDSTVEQLGRALGVSKPHAYVIRRRLAAELPETGRPTVSDLVVTVPKDRWLDWLAEGDLPGEPAQYESHFWISAARLPQVKPGDRLYIVARDRLRGYAPIVRREERCLLAPQRACLVRRGGAVAVTIDEEIRGFQGWRYRWWDTTQERAFPDWMAA